MVPGFPCDALASQGSDGKALTSAGEIKSVVCRLNISAGRGGGEYIGGLSL